MYEQLAFTNSDPSLVRAFLFLFRKGFKLDERKFHVCVHLHEYHVRESMLEFWSHVTSIPRSQFMKPYIKPHTGKRVRIGYNGCVAISYYDVTKAREVLTLAEAFFKKLGP